MERRLRVFENRLLVILFGPKWAEVKGEWIKLHQVELNDLKHLPTTSRVITSRIIRCSRLVADMGKGEVSIGSWFLTQKERDHIEGRGLDGKMTLRWAAKKWDVGRKTGSICLRIGIFDGHL